MLGNITTNIGAAMEAENAGETSNYSDECYMLDYIDVISAWNRNDVKGGKKVYTNFIPVTCSDTTGAYEIISRLTSRAANSRDDKKLADGIKEFINIRPADLALLQPKVRLYKVIYPNGAGEPNILEIQFGEHIESSILDMIGISRRRTGGAGLKDFSWTFAGTNPASAEKAIDVSMTLTFQTIRDLLGDKYTFFDGTTNPSAEMTVDQEMAMDSSASFLDLIWHPPTSELREERRRANEYIPKHYRIKAEVGWAIPTGKFPSLTSEEAVALKAELRKMNLSMYLNLVSHELTIKENGGVDLKIDYVASIDSAIDGNSANILTAGISNSELAKMSQEKQAIKDERAKIRDMEEAEACFSRMTMGDEGGQKKAKALAGKNKKRKDKLTQKTIPKLEKLHAAKRMKVYRSFMKALVDAEAIRFLPEVDEDKIKEWEESLKNTTMASARPAFSTGGAEKPAADPTYDYRKALKNMSKQKDWKDAQKAANSFESEMRNKAKDSNKERVLYVYFGDLIEVACRALSPEKNTEADNMVLLTGPVIISHPRDGSVMRCNIADVPISFDSFQAFFMDRVIKRQLDTYPLKQFLKDLLERLLRPSLKPANCFPGNREQRNIEIGQSVFTISQSTYSSMKMAQMNDGYANISNPDVYTRFSPNIGAEHEYQCLFLYLVSYKSSDLRGFQYGNSAGEYNDSEKGIFHYTIGQDIGILRKIDFTRSDVQGLREARQADDKNFGQLRDVYNANVTLVGNNIYIPGMKLFLNPPFGFGDPTMPRSLSHLLGIGGYYDVIKVNSTISRGGAYSTDLECIYQQSGAETASLEDQCLEALDKLPGGGGEYKNYVNKRKEQKARDSERNPDGG
mgnify:CR=1 FL=1